MNQYDKQLMINTRIELLGICARNRDGSYSTQAARRAILSLVGDQLREAGFFNLDPRNLKQRHVTALLERWKAEGLATGTLKNRLSHLRWLAEKIGKQNIIPRTNTALGIERRVFVTNISKAISVPTGDVEKIRDPHLRLSIELQKAFGLRREESLKFQPAFALAGQAPELVQTIRLKDSWCKGGRPREIPVITSEQRSLLARALELAGSGSMIPANRRYVDQLKRYENATSRAGMSRLHGLRHQYAQNRYQKLTGRLPPALGGLTSRELSPEQRADDRAARLKISAELGHGRESVTAVYLGR